MNKKTIIIATMLLFAIIYSAHAQAPLIDQLKAAILDIACLVYCLASALLVGLALVVLVLTGIKYMTSADSADRSEAGKRIAYVVVGLMVLLLACPLINAFFANTVIDVTPLGPCSCDCKFP